MQLSCGTSRCLGLFCLTLFLSNGAAFADEISMNVMAVPVYDGMRMGLTFQNVVGVKGNRIFIAAEYSGNGYVHPVIFTGPGTERCVNYKGLSAGRFCARVQQSSDGHLLYSWSKIESYNGIPIHYRATYNVTWNGDSCSVSPSNMQRTFHNAPNQWMSPAEIAATSCYRR